MRKLRNTVGLVVLFAVGLRVAADLIAPLIPVLVALFALVCIFWLVLGRPGGHL